MPLWLARWIEAEQGRFSLLLPVAMAAAILVYFALPQEPPLWLGLGLTAVSAVALAACWRHPVARLLAALALAASLGFARAEWRTAGCPPPMIVPTGPTDIAGTVASIDILPATRRLTIAHPTLGDGLPQARDVQVKLRADDVTDLQTGAQISLYGKLFAPERPAYPGAWDAGRQNFFNNLGASGYAYGKITLATAAPANPVLRAARDVRAAIAANILNVLPVETGSIAVTLLTGDEQAIPPAERQNFISAGLAHILAVAGLHVGIVMGLAFGATRFALSRREDWTLRWPVKSLAALAALAAGAGYAALTGAHLPILRSLVMASLVTLGVLAGRRALSLRGLALAALVLMLITPEAVVGVSFQMSFSAVLALIAGYAALRQRPADGPPMGHLTRHIAALAYTSLLAGGASMPFAAYQFQQVQPYWIPANLLAVPLTAFWVLPLGLASLPLMPLHLAALALVPMGWGISIIVWLTARIAGLPAAMLTAPPMPDAAILCFTAGLIWLCIWRSRARLAGLAFMLAAALVYAAARPPDVLMSPDAKLLAIRAPGQIYLVAQPRASSYILGQWAPVWGGRPLMPAQCTGQSCAIGLVLLALAPPEDCAGAALLVSPQPVRNACLQTPLIDRVSVYENGATAAWIDGAHVKLLTDRQVQGARPWVTPYPEATTLR